MSDDVHTLQEQVLKLQAFKDYVHQRLDERGIETHPEGKHSKHGCRIGDRLDLVFETIDEKTDQIFQAQELLKQAELDIAGAKSEYLRREREREELVEALRTLVDWQNGPPLETYRKGWTAAMETAYRLLQKYEPPTEP